MTTCSSPTAIGALTVLNWTSDQYSQYGTWIGRQAIIDEFLPTAMSHYAPGSVSLEITGMIAEGDNVALQWTSRARTLDGSPYENDCIGVFTVRDGKIRSVREYMDTHYAYRALTGDPARWRRPVHSGMSGEGRSRPRGSHERQQEAV